MTRAQPCCLHVIDSLKFSVLNESAWEKAEHPRSSHHPSSQFQDLSNFKITCAYF
ncbi:hypothetical protein M413DRAFT_278147 [Hebeloma cylindrosporum]|uniref:Uncharacterized protein n=1 Tax=Hebeloma cylindrosporum TaxID=76867 RepID=A0A0C2Y8L3_HEBCY|nr:hypothetical protein M413DRAFT_278147 [Hebeloma cylindrosporum h7]